MRRLDSAFWTSWNKWLIYIFLAFMWGITTKGFATGNQNQKDKVAFLFYILPPLSVIALWWLSSFKQVTLAGDTLIIRDFRREARIPVLLVKQIHERRPRGMDHITIVFKSRTEFGWRVRIMTGISSDNGIDRTAKILRGAIEGKNIGVKINHVTHEPAHIPNPTNEKEIVVSGWTGEELSYILTAFADMYDNDLGHNFDYEVCPQDKGFTRVTFPHEIPAKQFSFLVNYLTYPKNYDLKARSISVVGRATLSPDFHAPNECRVGQKAVFYIPSDDQDYDLVYVRVGNETFKNSFATRHWKKVVDSRIPVGAEIS